MTDPCRALAAYVAGELDAGDSGAFELHLASCEPCGDAVADRFAGVRPPRDDGRVQARLLRAWKARTRSRPAGKSWSWLARVVDERDEGRPGGTEPETLDAELATILATPPHAALAALEQLPPDLRAPLELLVLRGKRYREIADELELPLDTVGTRIRHARQRLMEAFAAASPLPTGGRP